MKDGVIADFEITEAISAISYAEGPSPQAHSPRVVVAVPSGITEVEKRAVKDSATHAGAREVYLIEQPMASAIGVGLPVHEPAGNMIVDIGGGTCEIRNHLPRQYSSSAGSLEGWAETNLTKRSLRT